MSKLLTTLAAAVLLAACSKPDAPTLADAQSPAQLQAAVAAKQAAAAPQGDPAKPLADYQELTSGKQLRYAHLALSGLPVDYEKVAERVSTDYQQTQDAFKRKDIVAALKPAIDQEIAKVRQNAYFQMEMGDRGTLDSFNFEKKSFGVPAFTDAQSERYFGDDGWTKLVFANSSSFAALAVPDEAQARTIEGARGKGERLRLRVFMFLNGVVLGENKVRAQVMKVQLLDGQGTVLFTQ